jgi:hypothetical protein
MYLWKLEHPTLTSLIDGNTIKVKERNAHTKAVKTFDYNDHYMYDDNDNYVGYLRGPYLEPAGSGSVLLKGTFQEVSFKLYHVATPYSAFSTWNYGTSEIYSWKSNWGPQYGDGINGLNLLNTEKFTLADKIIFGQQQNWDMFRASLRLPKTSAISGKAWIDVNRDGINNDTGAKPPKTGVTVQLLDGYGNPARDYNGNIVPRIPVNPDGTYRFDNLAPGDYKVKFEDSYKAGFTYKDAQGSNESTNSDVNPTGITDTITLGINEEKPNIDAGITPLPSSIAGKAWIDDNKDGIQDDTEKTVAAETKVKLVDINGKAVLDFYRNPIEEVTVDANGNYLFENLAPGDYKVVFTAPDGQEFTQQWKGTDSTKDSNANRANGETETITLESGDDVENIDAGLIPINYQVTHTFKSGTEGYVLPQAVKDLLPANQTDKVQGQEVTPTQPTKTSVETDDGIWTFNRYDPKDGKIDKADINFEGTWVLTPKEYKVTHEFISATPGVELPEKVKALLPADNETYPDGTNVKPKLISEENQKVIITDGPNPGTWTFQGYDKDEKTIAKADQKFVGAWTFVPEEKPTTYNVSYEFVSGTPGYETLPEEVTKLLPNDDNSYSNGDSVTVKKPTNDKGEEVTKIITDEGTWDFISYVPNTNKIEGSSVKYVGTWEFTPKAYKATHTFVSGTEGKALPQEIINMTPANQENLADGKEVTPIEPIDGKTKVITNDGVWTFQGYGDNSENLYPSKTVDKADLEFVGKWTFEGTFYEVKHTFIGVKDGEEVKLPPEVMNLLPENQTGKKNGEDVHPTMPSQTEVVTKEGTWTFDSYSKDGITKKIEGADQSFEGIWTFTPADPASISGKVWYDTDEDGTQNEETITYVVGTKVSLTDINGDKVKNLAGEEVDVVTIGENGTYSFTNLPAGDYKVNFNAPEGEKLTLPKQGSDDAKNSDAYPLFSKPNEGSTTVISLKAGDEVKDIDAGVLPKEYKVTHEFIAKKGDQIVELPKELSALLPEDQLGKKDGEKVTPTMPERNTIATDDGVWEFQGYKETEGTINEDKGDINFVGTWVLKDRDYRVTYEYQSDTAGKDLPDVIKNATPVDNKLYKDGENVILIAPENQTVVVADGTWTFKGYKPETTSPIDKADQHYVGTWVFEEKTASSPASIGDLVWKDSNGNGIQDEGEAGIDGITVRLTDKDGNPVKDKNGNTVAGQITSNGGKYLFDNLNAGEYIVEVVPSGNLGFTEKGQGTDAAKDSDVDPTSGKTDIIILGENEEKSDIDIGLVDGYKVTYEYQSGTPGKDLPMELRRAYPIDNKSYKNGETIDRIEPTVETYRTSDGEWTFKEYDHDATNINGKNEHFIGYWTFKEEVPTGSVEVIYMTKDGKVIEGPTTVYKDEKVGTSYGVTHKDIPNYEYKGVGIGSADPSGTIEAETKQVIYVYEPVEQKTGSVQVMHITTDGKVLEGPTPVKDATDVAVGTDYTTSPETFEGYTVTTKLGDGSAHERGQVKEGTQTVIYVYEPNSPVEPETKTGSVDVVYMTEDGRILEGPTKVDTQDGRYKTTEKDFEDKGYTFKEMGNDTPASGEITENDQHVIYIYKPINPITPELPKGNVYVKYVTTDGKILEDTTNVFDEDQEIGTTYTTEEKGFTNQGYEFVGMAKNSAPAEGRVLESDQHVIYVYRPIPQEPKETKGSVDVVYMTTDGKVLAGPEDVMKDANVKTPYTTNDKPFDGYELVGMDKDSAPANGFVEEGIQHVIYLYEPITPPKNKAGSVKVSYIDINGNPIAPSTFIAENSQVGDPYTTEAETIEGYELIGIKLESAPVKGIVTEDEQEVIYVYRPLPKEPEVEGKGSVEVMYMTTDGRILKAPSLVSTNEKIGTEYKTEKLEFASFKYAGMSKVSATANGEVKDGKQMVIYLYEPATVDGKKTGDVVVSYVSEDGTVIHEPKNEKLNAPVEEEYSTEPKDIYGYKFLELSDGTSGKIKASAPSDGKVVEGTQNVIYVYEKLASISGRVWIDTNKDGYQDYTETKVPSGLKAILLDESGNPVVKDAKGNKINPIEIGKDGIYEFGNLNEGNYQVKFVNADGSDYKFTTNSATDEEKNSNADPQSGITNLITLTKGQDVEHVDAGVLPTDEPENPNPDKEYMVVYEFKSTDGKNLPQEVMNLLPSDENKYANGKKITAKRPAKEEVTTSDGTWTFIGYDNNEITIDNANGQFIGTWKFTPNKPVDPTDPTDPSNPDNEGLSISGKVWIDKNGDGIQDFGEGVPRRLRARLLNADGSRVYDLSGNLVEDIEIGPNGLYSFNNLKAGRYQVQFLNEDGTEYTGFTRPNKGDGTNDSDVMSDGKTGIITLEPGKNVTNIDAGVISDSDSSNSGGSSRPDRPSRPHRPSGDNSVIIHYEPSNNNTNTNVTKPEVNNTTPQDNTKPSVTDDNSKANVTDDNKSNEVKENDTTKDESRDRDDDNEAVGNIGPHDYNGPTGGSDGVKHLPKTGDGLNTSAYVGILLAAGAALTVAGIKARKKENE